MAAVPIYVWNGSAWQETGPTIPANPIKYQASAPSSPSTGDIWVDSDGDVTTGSQQFQRFRFVASGGETTISGADANGAVLAYTAGLEQVVLNGAVLVRGHDYTATNGTTITGLSPALVANDVLEVFSFIAFTVANTYTQSQVDGLIGGTGSLANAWTSFTPTWTNLTVGNGTQVAKYRQVGKILFFEVRLVFGSTTSITGRVSLDWPPIAPANTAAANMANVVIELADYSDGPYPGFKFGQGANTTKFELLAVNAGGTYSKFALLSSTVPFTWATSDEINLSGFYEVA